ncbi:MAG: hypothetical protein KF893_26395 [Caldilineaceae bacterium]|nr:hypothetical protein [Caldilineaceae bacterium]
MADEKKSEGGNKERSGKRRYFRRRNKPKKTEGGAEQAQGTPAKPAPRSGQAPDRKGPPPNKKRRSRRRRSARRGNQPIDSSPELLRETESNYEEPISVFVYTHIIRPAYRDMISDYRPESSFLEDGEHDSFPFDSASLLSAEIRQQIENQFRLGDQPLLEKPVVKISDEGWSEEGWDDDWDDDWEDEPEA